jgi:hypothetical protein
MVLRKISGLSIENLRLASGLSMARDPVQLDQSKSQVDEMKSVVLVEINDS